MELVYSFFAFAFRDSMAGVFPLSTCCFFCMGVFSVTVTNRYSAFYCAPRQGWQRNWICREAQRPENPVTCFPRGGFLPPTGIYYPLTQKRCVPRFFASRRMTSEAGRNPEEPEYAARNFMSHIRSLRDLGFSTKSLLSSVTCGDTFFQRKKAIALRHAAMETPGTFS